MDVFCNKSRWLQMCVYQRPLCCKNDHDRLLPIGLPTLNMDASIEKTSEFWLPSSSSIKLSWPSWLVRQRKHDTFVHYTISVQSHPSHPLNKSHSTTDTHNFFQNRDTSSTPLIHGGGLRSCLLLSFLTPSNHKTQILSDTYPRFPHRYPSWT